MKRDQILEEAEKCVCQSRDKEYGPIEDNFSTIAEFWNTYLYSKEKSKRDGEGIRISSGDVAIMMCLLKVARVSSGQVKADNFIDLAGYAACAGEISLRNIKEDEQTIEDKIKSAVAIMTLGEAGKGRMVGPLTAEERIVAEKRFAEWDMKFTESLNKFRRIKEELEKEVEHE